MYKIQYKLGTRRESFTSFPPTKSIISFQVYIYLKLKKMKNYSYSNHV